ncbi:hypothetical protein CTH30272_02846 [Allocatenococcus thiocycli]|nr:hypothetical protein CTH30272_02846 [Catenococcus thiocycli]
MINSKELLHKVVKELVIENVKKKDVINYFDDECQLLHKMVDQYIFAFFIRTNLPKAKSENEKDELVNECVKVVCMKVADFVDNKTDNL